MPDPQDTTAESSYRDSHVGAALATAYDESFWDVSAANGLNWALERLILDDQLDRRRPDAESALDFACGTGRVLEALESRIARTYGIDVSPDMLNRARARCQRSKLLQVDVTRGEGAEPPGAPYDVITAFRFFLNAEPELRRQALTWMSRQLAPGGLLVANFHLNPLSARGRYLTLRWRGRQRTPMIDVAAARLQLVRAGFEILDVVGYDYLPYRRDGAAMVAPGWRAIAERWLLERRTSPVHAGSFIVVATMPANSAA